MRIIFSAMVFVATAIAVIFVAPNAKEWVSIFHDKIVASPPDKSVGVVASLFTGVSIFLYIAISQNLKISKNITRYRWAELRLLQLGKMSSEEIITYHARYNWFSYAGLAFSTLLIITSLLVTDSSQVTADEEHSVIVFLSLALLGLSSIMLAIVDLFHTNSLSPLITAKKRFELIDSVIRIGGAAIILQVCAICVFLALINSWLSLLASFSALWLVMQFSLQRGVPLEDLKKERNLSDHELEEVRRA